MMPAQEHIVFEVGEWTVDSLAHTLTSDSTEHQIPPKALAVLVFLAQNHGRLVTRSELIDAVWEGNAYVGDNALNNAIWRIRQVLGRDAGGTEFVKTVPKTGYQLLPTPRFLKTEASEVAVGSKYQALGKYLAVTGILLAVGVAAVFSRTDPLRRSVGEPLAIVTQLPGRELYAAPSPDGTRFAFMHVSQSGEQDLYLQSLQNIGEQPERFTSGDTSNFSPTWAPDSRHLAYIRIDDRSRLCEVVIRDTHRNEEDVVDVCVNVNQRTLSWSPDGRWLVYRKADPEAGPGLYLKAVNPDFQPREELAARRISCTGCLLIDQEVSWSPDSRFLAVTRTRNRMSEDIYRFDIDEWEFGRLTYGEMSIEGHAWDKDGRNLLYVSDKHSLDRRMWMVDSISKEKREIGHEGAGFPAYLPDYESIMFYRRRANAYIAAIPLDNTDLASSFPTAVVQTSGSERNPSYSGITNKLVYYSNISGHNEIWISDPDGSNRRQLSNLKTNAVDPSWSPDGTKISFIGLEPNTESMVVNIYDFQTDSVSTIATGFDDLGFPTWAGDGQSLIVPIWRGAEVDLWRVALDGDQLTRITTTGGKFGRESADGQYLYYTKADTRGLYRMTMADGTESLVISDIVSSGIGNWTFAGPETVLYARRRDGHSQIVRYDLTTSARTVLVRHPGRTMHRFGMLTYSEQLDRLYFTHREPQQIDILMAPDPLAALDTGS